MSCNHNSACASSLARKSSLGTSGSVDARRARSYVLCRGRPMPTVLRISGFRFFFYSLEGSEPPHIHVAHGDSVAKFWLDPVNLAESHGFRAHELKPAAGARHRASPNFSGGLECLFRPLSLTRRRST